MNTATDLAEVEMPAPLVFTDNAAKKVKELIEEEGTPDLKLRVFVSGGGCSGFQYGFTFEEEVNESEDFDFNQDFEIEEETRSPGWIRYQKRIK